MSGTYDITTYAGSTFSLGITWRDDNEDPIDLTTYDARLQVRGPGAKLRLDLTEGNGLVINEPETGHIDVLIDAETLAAVKPGIYRYELEMQAGDFATKILRGDFRVISEVAV